MTDMFKQKVDQYYALLCKAVDIDYANIIQPLDHLALNEAVMQLLTTGLANMPQTYSDQIIKSLRKGLHDKVAKRRATIEQHLKDYGDIVEDILTAKGGGQ